MGLIPFVSGTSATVVSGNNTAVEAASGLAGQLLISADDLKATSATFQVFELFVTSKNGLRIGITARDVGKYRLDLADNNFGVVQSLDYNWADLPSGDVIVFFKRFASTNGMRIKILGPTGTVYADSGTGNSPGGALSMGAGTGVLTVKNANTAASGNHGWRVRGLALYSSEITGAAEYAVPTTSSSGLIALYRFATGADDAGGSSMTPTSVSFDPTTDSWDPATAGLAAFGRYRIAWPRR